MSPFRRLCGSFSSSEGSSNCPKRGCRRPPTGAKGEKGTVWFPFPLLTPPNPPSSRSAKHSRLNGGDGGSVPCVGQLMGRLSALRLLCVSCRAYQCAARRCRALALRCEKLRFHQALTLGAPNAPVGPSHLDARPEGVASKGGSGVSRGEREPSVPCPLLSPPGDPGTLRRQTAAMPRHVMANIPPPGRASLASSGAPLYRRGGQRSAGQRLQ